MADFSASMEPNLEHSLEIMNLTGQQQPSSQSDSLDDDDITKLLTECPSVLDMTFNNISTDFDPAFIGEPLDISSLIDSHDDQANITSIDSQLSRTSIDDADIVDLIDSYTSNEQPQQSTFIEHHDALGSYPSQPVGNSPVEPKINDNSFDVQAYLNQQEQWHKAAVKKKRSKTQPQHATTVGPVDYYLQSAGCQPCTTQIQNDYVYQQQTLEYDSFDSKQIIISHQPRRRFRPRTQNESRNSAHYLRCEEGVKPEYPTIRIPQEWAFQADVNFIEVALMTVNKTPHRYTLENKNSSPTLEDHVLIFKQNEPNILYFRLTNEDFISGYKTFMLELIKSKQDNVITKEVIRTEQLEHSILKFTRIFQVGKSDYQRDEGSTEYSTTMSEAYGDVDVEHMGPRYGPMGGEEMVYMVLKGRILKGDLKIEVTELNIGWSSSVTNFTKNGNVVYFQMPAYPCPQAGTAKANIIVYYKDEELFQNTYLYKQSLDQELAELRLNDPDEATASTSVPNKFSPFDLLNAIGTLANASSRRSSTAKAPKRLKKK